MCQTFCPVKGNEIRTCINRSSSFEGVHSEHSAHVSADCGVRVNTSLLYCKASHLSKQLSARLLKNQDVIIVSFPSHTKHWAERDILKLFSNTKTSAQQHVFLNLHASIKPVVTHQSKRSWIYLSCRTSSTSLTRQMVHLTISVVLVLQFIKQGRIERGSEKNPEQPVHVSMLLDQARSRRVASNMTIIIDPMHAALLKF